MSDQSVDREILRTIEVRDPAGHRSVLLEGLRSSATVSEIRARATSQLRLPLDVDWNMRHEATGRLLQDDQRLGEFANGQTQVDLRLQPDAGLG